MAKIASFVQNFSRKAHWPLALISIYLIMIYIIQPSFFSPNNIWALIYYTCLLVPAVLGMHTLILLGLFDLSIGAVAAVSGVITAKAMTSGVPVPISLLLGLIVGVAFGFLNWAFVVWLRISALIATFITLGIARALSLGITEGQSIGGLPDYFGALALGTANTLISPAILFGLILVGGFEFLMRRQILFRRLYQVGSNPAAAASSGINVNRIMLFGFVIAGAGSAIAGLFQCSRTLSASPFLFPNLALECIAACVIGGASLSGGTGRAAGSFLGMLMVVLSRNLVVMAGVSIYWQELGIALVLLAAVLLKSREERASSL